MRISIITTCYKVSYKRNINTEYWSGQSERKAKSSNCHT